MREAHRGLLLARFPSYHRSTGGVQKCVARWSPFGSSYLIGYGKPARPSPLDAAQSYANSPLVPILRNRCPIGSTPGTIEKAKLLKPKCGKVRI